MAFVTRSSLAAVIEPEAALTYGGSSGFTEFVTRTNTEYGWHLSGVPVGAPVPVDQVFYDRQFNYVPGSWVVNDDHWIFSMAWPQTVGVPNYLTMSTFGDAVEAVGMPSSNARLYPINLMPRTARPME